VKAEGDEGSVVQYVQYVLTVQYVHIASFLEMDDCVDLQMKPETTRYLMQIGIFFNFWPILLEICSLYGQSPYM
jgi:hypothetical protein